MFCNKNFYRQGFGLISCVGPQVLKVCCTVFEGFRVREGADKSRVKESFLKKHY
jgi:hypothetical protein